MTRNASLLSSLLRRYLFLHTLLLGLECAGFRLGAFRKLLETIDTTGGIDEFFLAGIEWVALGTDFYAAGRNG